jgi:hypothetical protein
MLLRLLKALNGVANRFTPRVMRILSNVANRTSSRLMVFCLVALAATWFQLSTAGSFTDFRDYQYLTLFENAARVSVAKYHQLPLWDPYYCGGVYGLGTPSAHFVSPMFLLSLVFGVARSDSLIAFAMTVVGLEGVWRYARARGAPAHGAMLAAPIFALSGLFANLVPLGGMNFYSFELVPWAAFGLHQAFAGRVRGAVIAALALGWMVGHGGTYPAPMMLLIGVLELGDRLVQAWRKRRPTMAWDAITMGALAVMLATAVSLVRLWPVAEVLASGKRLLGTTETNGITSIAVMLFNGPLLIGVVALPVAILGLGKRQALPVAIICGVLVWLAMGYVTPSAFAVLRKIPPYTMLRAPARFLTLFALYFAVLAAFGVRWLEVWTRERGRPRWPVLVACILLVSNLIPLLVNQTRRARERELMSPPTDVARDFHQARGDRWLASFYVPMSRGTLSCFDDYDIPQSPALRGDLTQEEFLAEPKAGTVSRVAWSPNRIDLHAELTRPARIVINQNWHPGWRSSVGTVVDDQGRLAIDAPAGTSDLAVRFLPRSALGGIGATLLALVVAAILWRRWPGLPPRGVRALGTTFALAGVPFIAPLAVLWLVHEPHREPPKLVTPNGEAIVVTEPPPGSEQLGIRFEGGITLEAVRVALRPGARDEPAISVELDWRQTSIQRGIGVFIHIEPDGGDALNIDHVRISTAVPLEDLPIGATLRDVVPPIDVERPKSPKAFVVYAGLWRARGDGSRLKVLDASPLVTDNRVRIGSVTVP